MAASLAGRAGAALFALLAVPALAGPPGDAVQAAQAAAGVEPADAATIRFTAIRPGGAGATIYEATRGAGGVSRTITDLSAEPGGGWSVDGRDTKPMAAETLDYFTGRIDAAIAAAPTEAPCRGAPDYYAEHGANGLAGGGCTSDHPNAAIARALGLAEPVQP